MGLKPLTGLCDQVHVGSSTIGVRKGSTAFAINYATFSGNHEQTLKAIAAIVASRL
jgi:hypothetical protein